MFQYPAEIRRLLPDPRRNMELEFRRAVMHILCYRQNMADVFRGSWHVFNAGYNVARMDCRQVRLSVDGHINAGSGYKDLVITEVNRIEKELSYVHS